MTAAKRRPRGTLEELRIWEAMQDEGGPEWSRRVEVRQLLTPLVPDSANPARLDAVRWADSAEDVPDGVPFPTPDNLPDFVAYFDEEARACDTALNDLEGLTLPDGVTLEEARQVVRLAQAGWMLWASMGRVLMSWEDV